MTASKIITEQAMSGVREDCRREGRRVGFTNGCFDILHAGHVRYLQEASSLVDVLIVGLNDDDSVRAIKGPERPIVGAADRAEVLAALEAVSYVVLFADRTAERLVRRLQPDVYVKGEDYSLESNVPPEATVVRDYGGDVRFVPLRPGVSSSALIEKIRGGPS